MRSCFRYSVLALFCFGVVPVVSAQEQRILTPDDAFRVEKIGDLSPGVALSPDGQMLAYVRRRPLLAARTFAKFVSDQWDYYDIWLAPLAGGEPVNLTNGEADGSGYFMPTWSPDGRYLAMLSTKGGENVHLWVWEKSTGQIKQLSDRGVLISFDLFVGLPFTWIDNRRLVTTLLPTGACPTLMSLARQTATVAMREWPKAWAGKDATANVLDSTPPDLDSLPQQDVTILDVAGRARRVGSGAWLDQLVSPVRNVQVSPDGQHIAFMKQVGWVRPNPGDGLVYNLGVNESGSCYQLTITDLSGQSIVPEAKAVKCAAPNTFQWSRDGRTFAFIGTIREGDDYDVNSLRVFRGNIGGAIDSLTLADLDLGDGDRYRDAVFLWAEGNRLLLTAAKNNRKDWWLISLGAAPRNLTGTLKSTPGSVMLAGRAFLAVADGDLWRLDLNSEEWTNLTAAFDAKISAIVSPNADNSRNAGISRIVISFSQDNKNKYGVLDLSTGNVARITSPSEDATLVAYGADVAVFSAVNRTGTYLMTVRADERRTVVETNLFLREIEEGTLRRIDYRGLDGQNLIGWVLLPPYYQAGKRYPLVTAVYASIGGNGTVYGEKPPFGSINRADIGDTMDGQLLAARGYAVLFPSIPIPPLDERSRVRDPYMEITKGVLPAVDKVIEMGIGDAARLAVVGASQGGYVTYALVTQSNRFRAAVAQTGWNNLISHFGTFAGNSRYSAPRPYPNVGGEGSRGAPPWKDALHYLRNSPISYVDRVQTPLLMVHGDLDPDSIQQAEEFFTALQRQGKRAQFVRYVGEGHILQSPANIRDLWTRVYAWLDEFCDISRDDKGNLIFEDDHVRSRKGGPPLTPEDFARFNEIELKSHPWVPSIGKK